MSEWYPMLGWNLYFMTADSISLSSTLEELYCAACKYIHVVILSEIMWSMYSITSKVKDALMLLVMLRWSASALFGRNLNRMWIAESVLTLNSLGREFLLFMREWSEAGTTTRPYALYLHVYHAFSYLDDQRTTNLNSSTSDNAYSFNSSSL